MHFHMATVINNPGQAVESSSSGTMIGVLLAIVLIVLFVLFGLPALRRSQPSRADLNVNITTPNLPNPAPAANTGGGGNP